MSRRRWRWFVFAPLLVLAVLLGADVLLWRWAMQALQADFAGWSAGMRADGYTVTPGPLSAGGYPLAAELRISDLAISGPLGDLPVNVTWSAPTTMLRITLLHPRTLVITALGDQHLRLPAGVDLPFTAATERLTIPLLPGAPSNAATLEVAQLRATGPLTGLAIAQLRAHTKLRPAALQGEPAFSLTADATGITLPQPPNLTWPLGPNISLVSLDAALTGPMPRTPSLAARATGWRDGGGTLEVQHATLQWGPLDLTGSATLALDDHLQPMGAATARIHGYVATLDALASARIIPPPAAMAAKAVLGLMAHTPQDGGPPEVEVPLTLQNRALSVGRIPLAHLPEFSWPDAP
jgi:hypothetical protein